MTKTCVVDGAVIDYEDTGAGPVVVFVHGVYVDRRDLASRGDRHRGPCPLYRPDLAAGCS